ncbi:MAG: phenylacetate-CoA oxygenase subunit PaaJ [Burkholderiales bacterium]|nr:phenylacetate-CoA oxygenase subunit PaaJ [Burkholderiales bacterium]
MGGAEVRSRADAAWAVLATVPDPELVDVSIVDLGIVRAVRGSAQGTEVVLTPTYSGCPATELIAESVCQALDAAGFGPTRTTLQRAPAWTTDWISETGRAKLRALGIAPPGPASEQTIRFVARAVACPRCGAAQTERLSAFGATACKALYRCLACREPFEHFKPL